MRADRETILAIVRQPERLSLLRGATLDLALRQLRRLKLLARVAHSLQQCGRIDHFSPPVRDQLQSALFMAQSRARLARWEMAQLARVLEPNLARPVIVLKGSAYLLLELPMSAGRMLTDVDLLVPEDQIRITEARLLDSGWVSAPLNEYDDRYYREWTHEIPPLRHVEREIEVDVHHNILQRTARLKPSAALLLAQARAAGNNGLSVLAPIDMLLHAMTHLFHSSELDDALRELVDIDALARHFAHNEPAFWAGFVARARDLDLERPAAYALRYAARWLATPVPAEVTQELAARSATWPALAAMDLLVPGALFAQHPDRPDSGSGISRRLLLARSHWIRMPPLLLARHLVTKAWRRA